VSAIEIMGNDSVAVDEIYHAQFVPSVTVISSEAIKVLPYDSANKPGNTGNQPNYVPRQCEFEWWYSLFPTFQQIIVEQT
jgi:hypothetical protein